MPHHFGHEFRIGIGGLLGGTIPGNIGLDNHNILSAHKTANAAKIFESMLNKRPRLSGCGRVRPSHTASQ